MPFPGHAVSLREYIESFPFDLHSAAVFDSHTPSCAHAMPRPFRSESDFSRPRHSAAWHVWISIGRPETATCPRSTSSGYHAEFHEGCYQKHTNPLNWKFGYFRLPRGLSQRTRHCRKMAGARYGMETAWMRHCICELALTFWHRNLAFKF
jgi:hypothetical protein